MNQYLDQLRLGMSELGLQIGETQLAALLSFIDLIAKWNKTYNLTAVREPGQMLSTHILDSLSVLRYVKPPLIADIGTGAGLPGIPLAICMPDSKFVLLDANSKKSRFVRQAVLELRLDNVDVLHQRVESFHPEHKFSTVITRAFAAIPEMIKLCNHLLASGGVLLAMKGQTPLDELAGLEQNYSVAPLSVPGIEGERCLVRLEMH
jgi:16S rRNA (guanine527-N7)-methyltransferase